MLSGWVNTQSKITAATVKAYLQAVLDQPLDALREACREFGSGTLARDHGFPPSAAELADRTRFVAGILARCKPKPEDEMVTYRLGEEPPPGFIALGPVTVDFGHGPIDMRDMHPREKQEVIARKGLLPAAVTPKLQGMR